MRYRFRLATVRRVRRAQESAAREALHHANAALVVAIAARDAAAVHYREVETADAADAETLRRDRLFAELAATALARARKEANRKASEAALAHVEWQLTARRVAALDRLDERRRLEHAVEENRREIAVVDDVVTARFVSASRAEGAA